MFFVIPPGGLGTRLDAMYEFHAHWCFADLAIAELRQRV
jgi:hypothetical protein